MSAAVFRLEPIQPSDHALAQFDRDDRRQRRMGHDSRERDAGPDADRDQQHAVADH